MALFKIYNNIGQARYTTTAVTYTNSPTTGEDLMIEPILPNTHHTGYMYFDAQTCLFFIDVANDEDNVDNKRVAVNAHGAEYALRDIDGRKIHATYLKIADAPKVTFRSWTGTAT